MKLICERCQAEGRVGIIDEDSAGLPAADNIGGLCLEHAFVVLEEMRLAMHVEMCASRDRVDDESILGDHMPVGASFGLDAEFDLEHHE